MPEKFREKEAEIQNQKFVFEGFGVGVGLREDRWGEKERETLDKEIESCKFARQVASITVMGQGKIILCQSQNQIKLENFRGNNVQLNLMGQKDAEVRGTHRQLLLGQKAMKD